MSSQLFDHEASRYDAWYDTAAGSDLFAAELAALRPLVLSATSPRLEVGVGTGRFAAELGIEYGVDVAAEPLKFAIERNVNCAVAAGEELPFGDNTFGGVIFVFTLCFVDDPLQVIQEAKRVLLPNGLLVLGVVPADGPLGRHYQKLGSAGHRIYQNATFYTRSDLEGLLKSNGLAHDTTRSALIDVTETGIKAGDVRDDDHPQAGFLVISARKLS